MSTSIPTAVPTSLRAGDTWAWRIEDLVDYPASAYTLKYRFKTSAGGFEITAAADGNHYAIAVAAAVTAVYVPGTYDFIGWVEAGAAKYTVVHGRLTVAPNLRAGSAESPLDLRSPARQYLERLEAALIARDPTLAAYTIQTGGGSRTKQFTTLADVRAEYDRVRAQVHHEDAAAAVAAGLPDPRRAYVRFAAP